MHVADWTDRARRPGSFPHPGHQFPGDPPAPLRRVPSGPPQAANVPGWLLNARRTSNDNVHDILSINKKTGRKVHKKGSSGFWLISLTRFVTVGFAHASIAGKTKVPSGLGLKPVTCITAVQVEWSVDMRELLLPTFQVFPDQFTIELAGVNCHQHQVWLTVVEAVGDWDHLLAGRTVNKTFCSECIGLIAAR
jgi:hypothetical protein